MAAIPAVPDWRSCPDGPGSRYQQQLRLEGGGLAARWTWDVVLVQAEGQREGARDAPVGTCAGSCDDRGRAGDRPVDGAGRLVIGPVPDGVAELGGEGSDREPERAVAHVQLQLTGVLGV